MTEPKRIILDVNQLECIVAAILTDAQSGENARDVVRRYADIYAQLQAIGDVVVPESTAA